MDGAGRLRNSRSRMKHRVVIIGCGFGGLASAIELKKAGIHDFVILERAGDVGGVWRDNIYPGAACDVVAAFYSLSYAQDDPWSTAWPQQPEIHAYIRRVVERHGVGPHIRFNTEVAQAAFDETTMTWKVEAKTGERFEADVLVSAVGLFNRPFIPDFPGRGDFAGPQFHSAQWDRSAALAGKRVAVIGNGASAVQFLPRVAQEAAHLTLFQRTPQYVMPRGSFPGSRPLDLWLRRSKWLRRLGRLRIFLNFERRIFERYWRPEGRLKGEAFFRKFLEAKVKDPELRRKLTPNYALGCKRLLASDEWYDALVRPNVAVVDTPIERIESAGIRTRDGTLRAFDAIIYGTGFTPTAYLTPMKIAGLGGRDLNQAWRDGAEAYLGIAVAGFPNFFMLYGPNTNTVTSIIFMLECQARYIVQAVQLLRRRGGAMTVRADVQARYVAGLQERLSRSVVAMPNCFSYTKQANGRITTQWPGQLTEYRLRTARLRISDYDFIERRVFAQAAE